MTRRLHPFLRDTLRDLLLGFCMVAILVMAGFIFLAFHHITATAAHVIVRPKVLNAAVSTQKSFGVAFGNTLSWQSQPVLDAQLADIRALGFTWLRTDIDWAVVQPNDAQHYDWSDYDRVVASANAHGLHVLATVAYAPQWARAFLCRMDEKCMPADNHAYAVFAKAAVARYSSKGVKTWEIWNEPNLTATWKPAANAKQYTAMLKVAYGAIKSADANAFVLSAGLSPAVDANGDIAPRTFLKAMYAAGARGSFDALGDHPYSYPAPPDTVYSWSGWSQMGDLSTSLRSIMQANGDTNKQIWATEYGAPTNGPGVTPNTMNYPDYLDANHVDENLQALLAEQAVNAIAGYNWAGPMFWYSYKDIGTDTTDNENFFGIIRADGSHKPAYDAFKRLLSN